tara:strand:+ start:85 stop:651 length:567 start_codon:yes stop_codon:yes gene_type:complete
MKVKGLPFNFSPIPTVGDGSCFIHAVIQGFCPPYHKLSQKEKMLLAKSVRNDLALTLQDDPIYKSLSRGEIEEISKNVKEMSKQYMQAYLVSGHWINMSFIELISNIFDINIIIVSNKTKDFYYSGDPEIYFKKRRESVFIYYYDNAHFETMAIETTDGHKTLFDSKSQIVKESMKRLFQNKIIMPKK